MKMATYPGMNAAPAPMGGMGGMAPPADPNAPTEVVEYCIVKMSDNSWKYGIDNDAGSEDASEAPETGAPDAEDQAEPDDDAGMQTAGSLEECFKGIQALDSKGNTGDAQKGFDTAGATMPNGPFQQGGM